MKNLMESVADVVLVMKSLGLDLSRDSVTRPLLHAAVQDQQDLMICFQLKMY